MLAQPLTALAVALVTVSLASAQNDECATAIPIGLGATAFDTTLATLSPEAWPCASLGGPDLWYTYTATSDDDLRISTCGSTYDTALDSYTGSCAALVPLLCNDDLCGLQSVLDISGVTAGSVYIFRVGGFNSAVGTGMITITELAPPPALPPECVETLFFANNGGSVGGAVYFDITVTQPISVGGLLTNTSIVGPLGMTVFTAPGTHVGFENDPAAWTQVAEDDGLSSGLGADIMTSLTFVTPFTLAPGTYGIALVGDNVTTSLQMDHDYTNGNGMNENHVSGDGVISLSLGTATNAPFVGGIFSPRVWNGRLCNGVLGAPGTNYGTAVANSTGVPGSMRASGSADVAMNNLVLVADDLPQNSFGFFLTSSMQGFTAMPGGSLGNLLLDGSMGRYDLVGQIMNSGTAGRLALAVDNTMHPTPMGFVTIVAGETWYYQAWYRDLVGGAATSNFTDGLEITHD